MFGRSQTEMTQLSHFITGRKYYHPKMSRNFVETFTAVKTIDVFSLPVNKVRHEMKMCVAHCHPGPNVLLLLVKPSDFTEKDRQKLKFILSYFGSDAFKYSMVVITQTDGEGNSSVNQLTQDCMQRQHIISLNEKDLLVYDPQELIEKMKSIVNRNRGQYLNFSEECETSECPKAPLNLVFCGRHGLWKSAAMNAILGDKKFSLTSDSAECDKGEAEVCGKWVSLVKLPGLSGKSREEANKKALQCISLCDPDGVNAFVLVLPLQTQTEEDKKELEAIQNIFSNKVKDFMVILFTTKAISNLTMVEKFLKESRSIQQLFQSCGRYVVFNILEKQQVFYVLHAVDQIRIVAQRGFTKQDMPSKPLTRHALGRASQRYSPNTESIRTV